MSHRHLPAGQPMPGGGGGVSPTAGAEMGPGSGPIHIAHGSHGGHGPHGHHSGHGTQAGHGSHGSHGNHGSHGSHGRRRPLPAHASPYHYQPPTMYPNYMHPYAAGQYYQQQVPPQYQAGLSGGMPSGYMPFQPPYMRSPPSMQQFVPMAGVSVAQPYPRHHQQSPALATPYQPPPVPGAVLPQTPTSTHSSHAFGEAPLVVASPSPAAAPQVDRAPPTQQPPPAPSTGSEPTVPVPVAQVEPVAQQQQPEPELVSQQPSAPSPQPVTETIAPEAPPKEPFRPPVSSGSPSIREASMLTVR